LFERLADPIEGLIGEIVRERAIASIEVRHQASTHFDVGFTVRFHTIVEPLEQAVKCELRNFRFFS